MRRCLKYLQFGHYSQRVRRLRSAALLLVLVAGSSAASGASPRRDEILFVGPSPVASYNFDVLATGADGKGTRVVVRNSDQEPPDNPRWSPDGRRVVVTTQVGLMVAAADGSSAKLITVEADTPVGARI